MPALGKSKMCPAASGLELESGRGRRMEQHGGEEVRSWGRRCVPYAPRIDSLMLNRVEGLGVARPATDAISTRSPTVYGEVRHAIALAPGAAPPSSRDAERARLRARVRVGQVRAAGGRGAAAVATDLRVELIGPDRAEELHGGSRRRLRDPPVGDGDAVPPPRPAGVELVPRPRRPCTGRLRRALRARPSTAGWGRPRRFLSTAAAAPSPPSSRPAWALPVRPGRRSWSRGRRARSGRRPPDDLLPQHPAGRVRARVPAPELRVAARRRGRLRRRLGRAPAQGRRPERERSSVAPTTTRRRAPRRAPTRNARSPGRGRRRRRSAAARPRSPSSAPAISSRRTNSPHSRSCGRTNAGMNCTAWNSRRARTR